MKKPTTPDVRKGLLYAGVGTAMLSCNYIVAKYAMTPQGPDPAEQGFNPETLTVLWMGAATIYALIWTVAARQARSIFSDATTCKWLLLLGLVNAVTQLTQWQGLSRIDPSFSAFIGRFAPMVSLTAAAMIFKERLTRWEWLAIAVMIAGGLISSWNVEHFGGEGIGIFLTIVSTVFAGFQWVIGKHAHDRAPEGVMNLYRVGVAALVATIFASSTGKLDFTHAAPSHWIATLIGSFTGPFLSVVLMFRSYRYWEMSRTSVVHTLQPLVVMPLAFLVFGTAITGLKLTGGLITLGGGLALALLHRKVHKEVDEDVEAT